MPVSRMRMRPWLEQKIDSGTIPGLSWIDKEKTMFTIPWKHAARHGWEMDKDASLFREWAIHTGKYSDGQTTDPKTWKANFRCAMNSLPDIEEVKDRSINKGHGAQRVFKMLPVVQRSRDKRSRGKEQKLRKKVKMEDDSSDYSEASSPSASSPKFLVDELSLSGDSSNDPEVQDYPTFEIGTDNTYRFEVSPARSLDDDFHDIIEICKDLENEGLDRVNLSPEPTWSESSSDYGESTPHYTTLGSDFTMMHDSLWNLLS